MPHDHLMWANIGIYTGREVNIFWKRTSDGIKAFGADALFVKDTAMLPNGGYAASFRRMIEIPVQ